MFLIEATNPYVENTLNFLCDCFWNGVGSVQNKASFVSFCILFVGGTNNIIQKTRKTVLVFFSCMTYKVIWREIIKVKDTEKNYKPYSFRLYRKFTFLE